MTKVVDVTVDKLKPDTRLGMADLAKLFGYSRKTVSKYVHKADIKGQPLGSKRAKYKIEDAARAIGFDNHELQKALNRANKEMSKDEY